MASPKNSRRSFESSEFGLDKLDLCVTACKKKVSFSVYNQSASIRMKLILIHPRSFFLKIKVVSEFIL